MPFPSNDDLREALIRAGYSTQLNDGLLELLKRIYNLSFTTYNDALYYHLGQIPYVGSLSDRIAQWDGTTTVLEALGIINSKGTDAHAYIFGLGSINGLQAGNYLESTASTAATVDGLAGFVTDAFQGASLGAELVTNGGFDSDTAWTKGTGWTISGGTANHTGVASSLYQTILTVGKSYLIEFDYTASGVMAVYAGTASASVATGSGRGSVIIQCATLGQLQFYGASNYTVDNISVREVPGIHATQATTANKPILRYIDGKYSWQFDGSNDSLSLGSVPFQMSDDHSVFVCANPSAVSGTLFSIGSTSSNTPRIELSINASGYAVASWIDDAATTATITGSTDLRGATHVYALRKATNAKQLYVDGVQIGSTENTAMGATTVNAARIGATAIATPSLFLTGFENCVIAVKANLTDSQFTTLDRFCGLFGGVTI